MIQVVRRFGPPSPRSLCAAVALAMVVAGFALTTSASPASATAARVRNQSDSTTASAPADEQPHQILDYRYGPDPYQFINLYFPGGPGPYPVVFYLHSGGWVGGAKEYIPDFLLAQVDRAKIALVSIDYRLSSFAPDGSSVNAFPIPNEDVDQAIRFVRSQADTWNLESKMFVVSGGSAGGHLAQMAGVDPGHFVSPSLPSNLRRVSPDVQGMMDFVGPSDLVWLIHNAIGFAHDGVLAYLGCPGAQIENCSEETAREASPQTYVSGRKSPPGYFAYGAQDTMVPADTQGLAIAQPWAAALGDTTGYPPFSHGVYFELVENAGHNLDMTNFDYHTMETWLDAVIGGKSGGS
jgi:acetyl esterase/lipase